MRSADPAAYDQFAQITSGVAFNYGFRGLMLTNSTAGASSKAECTITQLVNGSETTKTMTFVTGVGVPTIIIPISGEKITATITAGSGGSALLYALI